MVLMKDGIKTITRYLSVLCILLSALISGLASPCVHKPQVMLILLVFSKINKRAHTQLVNVALLFAIEAL